MIRAPRRLAVLVLAGLLVAAAATADEIKVVTSGAFTAAYLELVPQFERATGHKVVTAFGPSMGSSPDAIPNRLRRGDPIDVVILAASALDGLIADGKVAPGSRLDLVRSSIGMAVRSGAPKPDISTLEAFTKTVMAARSIAFSSSASGVYFFSELFPRLGITDAIRAKSRMVDSGPAGALVARGEAEIAFQQISELLPVAGIDYVGPLPKEAQRVTVFAAGIVVGARASAAATALLEFLASPAADGAIRKSGLEPARGGTVSEFVFERAPFASAHASTIVETREGLAAAWFGGTREGAADVGIWLSRHVASPSLSRRSGSTAEADRSPEGAEAGWTTPIEVATGVQADGTRHPCWNPVLFQMPDASLALFYKVGPSPQTWWGMVRTSRDDGHTWSEAVRLPDAILGPIKNKPVRLADGVILAPSSTESSDRPSRWRVHFERSVDGGRTWTTSSAGGLADGRDIDAIQPSILLQSGGRLEAVGRTRSGRVFETWSADAGKTWTPMTLAALPNPNSGIDAVTLRDGRQLIVYNHTDRGRSPLNVALSLDGKTWQAALVLESEPGEYSYPAVIQTSDGLVHITYTWQRRRIKHVVIDPAALKSEPMANGKWPQAIR
jgi:predicted neuraminidase/ABC-type molybdate transport system substrate-binding protein